MSDSALGSSVCTWMHVSALGWWECTGMHFSALGSWECTGMRESAKGCIEGTAVIRVGRVHESALGSWYLIHPLIWHYNILTSICALTNHISMLLFHSLIWHYRILTSSCELLNHVIGGKIPRSQQIMSSFDLHPILDAGQAPRPGIWYTISPEDNTEAPCPRVGACASFLSGENGGKVVLTCGATICHGWKEL